MVSPIFVSTRSQSRKTETSPTMRDSEEAALAVIASDELFPLIASFLPGIPTWLFEQERFPFPKESCQFIESNRMLWARFLIQVGEQYLVGGMHIVLNRGWNCERGCHLKAPSANREFGGYKTLDEIRVFHKTAEVIPRGEIDILPWYDCADIKRWLLQANDFNTKSCSWEALNRAMDSDITRQTYPLEERQDFDFIADTAQLIGFPDQFSHRPYGR